MINLAFSLIFLFSISAEDILNKTVENLGLVKTISGELEREVEEPGGKAKISGMFYFKSPDKLRINFTNPYLEVVLINGRTFIDYKLKKKEYTVRDLPDSLELGNSFLGLKQAELEFFKERFKFNLIWQGEIKGYPVYVLEGKGSESGISKVLVWIEQNRYIPLRLETYGQGKYPMTIYQVDSLGFVGTRYWQPTIYRMFLGVEGGTITITSRLSRLRVDEEIPDNIFELPLPANKPE